jgi:hypothetical protein
LIPFGCIAVSAFEQIAISGFGRFIVAAAIFKHQSAWQ